MRKSQIFESYAKIAEEKGLISKAYKNESMPRADSLSEKDIENLYNVKPNGDEKHIMEQAHPEPVIIAPSYDKINGLVENEIERQNITINIVNKPVDGILNQKKYAEQDLLMELVKIANDLDNKNQDDLRSLADHCINQVDGLKKNSKINKIAAIPVVPIAITAATLAGIWAINHMSYSDNGLKQNLERAKLRLHELVKISWFESDLAEDFKLAVLKLIDQIDKVEKSVNDFTNISYDALMPRSIDELESKLSELSGSSQDIANKVNSFEKDMTSLLPALNVSIRNFQDSAGKFRKNIVSDFFGSIGDALYGNKKYSLFTDDLYKAKDALEVLKESILKTFGALNDMKDLKKKYQQEIELAQKEAEKAKEVKQDKQDKQDKPDVEIPDDSSIEELLSNFNK